MVFADNKASFQRRGVSWSGTALSMLLKPSANLARSGAVLGRSAINNCKFHGILRYALECDISASLNADFPYFQVSVGDFLLRTVHSIDGKTVQYQLCTKFSCT